jgi:hypothetical protein
MTDRDTPAMYLPELDAYSADLELSAHIIGAFGNFPRAFQPTRTAGLLGPTARSQITLPARDTARIWLQVDLEGWRVVEPDWLAVTARVSDMNGSSLGGPRPALVYAQPYDVPTYTNFHIPEFGHISLGLRVIA